VSLAIESDGTRVDASAPRRRADDDAWRHAIWKEQEERR
jgi:hypothetical protein